MNEIRPDVSADAIASLSRRLIRRWRGDRSQLVLSVSLGFSSNVVAHWETGRRVPRASVALQLLESSAPTTLEPLAELFGLEQGIAPATQEGVRQIVADALEAVPLRRAADAIGVQRSTIVRWLGGQLEPRLTDLLACLAIGLRLGQFLQLTGAADHEFAGVVPEEFGPPEYQVFHGLQLDAYRALPAHSTTWLAERLVLTGDEVEEAIRRLHVGGWIEPRGSYWMAALRAPVLRPGILRVRGGGGAQARRDGHRAVVRGSCALLAGRGRGGQGPAPPLLQGDRSAPDSDRVQGAAGPDQHGAGGARRDQRRGVLRPARRGRRPRVGACPTVDRAERSAALLAP